MQSLRAQSNVQRGANTTGHSVLLSFLSSLYFGKILCRSNDVRTSSDKCSDSSGLQRMHDVVGITRVSID